MLMLETEFRKYICKNKLVKSKDRILIGVSGGPDSICLLHALDGIREEYGLKLFAAHVDHQLRSASKTDAAFVRETCKDMNVRLFTRRVTLAVSKHSDSIEQEARFKRYAFFTELARKHNIDSIALGHNLDDQAETVIMRLIRGSGLSGLSAMKPAAKYDGIDIIRPLLGITREKIRKYLSDSRIRYRIDRSNLSDKYARNRVRNRLLPLLEKEYNPNIKRTLATAAQSIAMDYDFIEHACAAEVGSMGKRIDIVRFRRLHPSMQNMVLRAYISAAQGNTRRIEYRHIQEIVDLICNRPDGSIVDLPQGLSAVKKNGYVEIKKA